MKLSPELRDRTRLFASKVIRLYVDLPKNHEEVRVIGKQMLRSGTSVAAHAREASRARSDAELCSKRGGLLQEADKTQLWVELLRDGCGITQKLVTFIIGEAEELIAIYTTIISKVRRNNA